MQSRQNRYYCRSRISERVFRRLIKAFAMDLTATDAAGLTGLSVRSVNAVDLKPPRRIAQHREARSPLFRGRGWGWGWGEVEIDESYLGPRRVRGKRGRDAVGKTIVFGVFPRNGHVYTEIVPDVRKATLRKAIRGRVWLDTIHRPPRRLAPRKLAMTAWSISATPGTCVSATARTRWSMAGRTPTAPPGSRAPGPSPSTASPSSRACHAIRSTCTSRRPSPDSNANETTCIP